MAVAISPPKEEEEEEKVIALFSLVVERLSKRAREEFARRFSKELKGTITPVAIAKAKKGKIHLSDKTIIDVALSNPTARRWVLNKAKEEASQTLELVELLKKKNQVFEQLRKEEELEEVEEE
jgi:hypothetical protein